MNSGTKSQKLELIKGVGGGLGSNFSFPSFLDMLLFGLCGTKNFLQKWKKNLFCWDMMSQSWVLNAKSEEIKGKCIGKICKKSIFKMLKIQ